MGFIHKDDGWEASASAEPGKASMNHAVRRPRLYRGSPPWWRREAIIREPVQMNTSAEAASLSVIRAHYRATIYIIKPGINN